jgi:hypothetical protein
VYVPIDRSIPVRVLDLATRAETSPALTQPAFATQPGVWVQLVATTKDRAVILTEGVGKFGRLLWAMNWQAKVDRLGPDTPEYTDEYFSTFSPSGGKALWSRQTNGLDGNPIASAGAYQADLTTLASSAWTDTNVDCFERPNRTVFALKGGTTTSRVVQACVCGGACTDIATITVPDGRWIPQLSVSANGSVAVVSHAWGLGSAPTAYPDITCLSLTGQVLATMPFGLAQVDATGQMVLLQEGRQTGQGRLGIVNLATGALTWVGTASRYAIVYE